jgi:Zn-dependent oligopeptidase
MAKVTITDAAKLAGISRAHLYKKYIKTGVISISKDHRDRPYIDTSEILRVFGELLDTSLNTQEYTNVDTKNAKEDCSHLLEIIAAQSDELRRAWDMVSWLQSKVDAMETRLLNGPTAKRRWWWPW